MYVAVGLMATGVMRTSQKLMTGGCIFPEHKLACLAVGAMNGVERSVVGGDQVIVIVQ